MPKKNPNYLAKRDERIEKLWRDGILVSEICHLMNLSRQRIHQILAQRGIRGYPQKGLGKGLQV